MEAEARPLVVLDGECVLCLGGARLLMRLDRSGRFDLTTTQAQPGRRVLEAAGVDLQDPSSFVLVEGGRFRLRTDAVLRIAWLLDWPWRAAVLLRVVPAPVRDWVYDWIARNRRRLIRGEVCDLSQGAWKGRILH